MKENYFLCEISFVYMIYFFSKELTYKFFLLSLSCVNAIYLLFSTKEGEE